MGECRGSGNIQHLPHTTARSPTCKIQINCFFHICPTQHGLQIFNILLYLQVIGLKTKRQRSLLLKSLAPAYDGVNFKSQAGKDTGFNRPPTKQPPPPHAPTLGIPTRDARKKVGRPMGPWQVRSGNKEGLEQETPQEWGADGGREGPERGVSEPTMQGWFSLPSPLSA